MQNTAAPGDTSQIPANFQKYISVFKNGTYAEKWSAVMKMSPAMPVMLRFLRHQPCSHHRFSRHSSFTLLLNAKIQKFPDICKQTSGNSLSIQKEPSLFVLNFLSSLQKPPRFFMRQ